MKTENMRNALVCSNCDSGELTLCLDFGEDEPAKQVTIMYRAKNARSAFYLRHTLKRMGRRA